jgi:hypothetical protein
MEPDQNLVLRHLEIVEDVGEEGGEGGLVAHNQVVLVLRLAGMQLEMRV